MLGRDLAPPALGAVFKLHGTPMWLPELLKFSGELPTSTKPLDPKQHVSWPVELRKRIEAVRDMVRRHVPWFLPEYEPLRNLAAFALPEKPLTPLSTAAYFLELDGRLHGISSDPNSTPQILELVYRLRGLLPECRDRVRAIASRLEELSCTADEWTDEMGFSQLINRGRNLLSIGYDVAAQKLSESCYDLLASEARTATFIAVAKEDLIQDGWFRLGRKHTACGRETPLISWTGTMFEYLMPVIWMRSHPNTLLDRTTHSAVRAQRAFTERYRVPWGISEAAYAKTDADGNYQYSAWGVPCLALSTDKPAALVISPYSSCLALMIDPVNALKNLLRMKRGKLLSEYGFYEATDYSEAPRRGLLSRRGEVVRCWMAHHEGMSLAAICNVLNDWPFQRWFHAERLVQASDLILQERPIRSKPMVDNRPRRPVSIWSKGSACQSARFPLAHGQI